MSKQIKLPTLLVVADNPSIRFWVKKHLDDQFFIIAAAKRSEALEALNARLDFIIVDADFEECDALDLTSQLSKLIHNRLIPILLITGRLKKSYRDKALESGVTDFLSDQLDVEELKSRIAAGEKAATARQKTEDFASSIKLPKQNFPSTYLKNKFLLNDKGLKLLNAAKSNETPTVLLFLKIDCFSHLESSDEVLSQFSAFLISNLRENDVLIPSSEGGFVILLPNTTTVKARPIAETLRKMIQLHRFPTKKGPAQLTVSIVISSLDASEQGFNKMLESSAKSLKAQSTANLIISLDQERT